MADLHLVLALRQAVESTLGALTFTTLPNRPTVIPTATAVPTATITAAVCNSIRGNEGHFHPTKTLADFFSWTSLKSVLVVTFLTTCWMLIIVLLGISVFQVLSEAFPLGENADEGEKKYCSCCRKCGGCVMERGMRLGSESGSGSGSASNHDADNKHEAKEKAGEQQDGYEERQDQEEEEQAEKEYREAEEKEYLRREEEERRLRWEMSNSLRKAARLVAEFRKQGLDSQVRTSAI
jgi:hypothetical protein